MKLKKLLFPFVLFTLLILYGSPILAQPTAGLVGHFKFDGNLTNIGSASMTATGSNISYGTNALGSPNKALMFAGATTSSVNITDNGNLDFTGDFSIAFGVYLTTTTLNQGLYDNCLNYGGCGIWFFASDNSLRFNFKNGSIGGIGAIPQNQWKAICAVRSGNTLRLYASGVEVASATEGSVAISYPYPPVLGQMFYQGTGGNYNPAANGSKIDEMRFYNRALTVAEVGVLVGFSLPLQLGDLTAVKKPSGIQLNWETITEHNTAYFDVERSSNGTEFSAIGRANARGNSSDKQYYSYFDDKPFTGTNYYRLKMADIDGSFTYSRVIAIKNDSRVFSIELFPNPVNNVLQVQLPSRQKEKLSLLIVDAGGKTVYSGSIQVSEGYNATSIQVSQLPRGIYSFVVENEDGRQSKTFLKQ